MAMLRVVTVAFVMSILMIHVSWAETAYDRQGDEIRMGAQLSSGVLDRIIVDENGLQTLIINDIIYNIDSDTKFTTASGSGASLSNFDSGSFIDFYALGELLTKVMPALDVEDDGSDNKPTTTAPTAGSNADDVHMEDGVWKN